MARHDATIRLFVAIHPPEDAARSMLGCLDALDLAPHRRPPPEQVHVTLQFIGETPKTRIQSIGESVSRAATGVGSFDLAPVRIITLPERGRPRLIAMETDRPGTLLELKRRLAKRLAGAPRADPADRFRPHLTLCRFIGSARAPRVDERIDLPPFPVDYVSLMRSELRPQGAHHEAVLRAPLTSR